MKKIKKHFHKRQRNRRNRIYNEKNSLYIKFGNKFSLFVPSEREKILKIIRAIKQRSENRYLVDFREVKELNPHSFLYLKQNIDRYSGAKFETLGFKSLVLRGVFQYFDLNSSFPMPPCPKHIYQRNDVGGWRLFTGDSTDFDTDLLNHFKKLQNHFGISAAASTKLITGIAEAISNVIEHAYPNDMTRQWHLLTHLDNKTLTVVVSDLGISVPATTETILLSNSLKHERVYTDSCLIRQATILGHSRSQLEYRGKGFDDILDLGKNGLSYDEIGRVFISILSRYGSYILITDRKNQKQQELSYNDELDDFEQKINGTIVTWAIELN